MSQADKHICVVLPTKNEAESICSLISEIRSVIARLGYSEPTIVVTDDSLDETRLRAREAGAEVISGGGKGLGFAMYKGLKHSLTFSPDYILACDADGQCDLNEIGDFLEPIERDVADMVIGSRFVEPGLVKYRYRFINRTGIRILSRILRAFTGLNITDSHGGIRAMKADVVRELEMLGTHTYVQETIIDAHEKGFRIKEIPSVWLQREHGGSKVVASIPTYVFYTLPILIIRSKQHIKWLYSTGIGLNIIAVLYFIIITWQADFQIKEMFSRLPSFVLITLFVLAGLQLFFFGFLLQIVKDIKYRVDSLDGDAG